MEMKKLTIIALVLLSALGVQAGKIVDPVASVTTNGVTTFYPTISEAWADATNKHDQVDVYVKLLKDVTVSEPLVRMVSGFIGRVLTLDLNDKILAYVGEEEVRIIQQEGGDAMHIIDTSATRTPHYFTCDHVTGLWTLTNEVTDLVVSGGIITGGRAGAASFTYGSGMISNVNFVGNYAASEGGAVSAKSGTIKIFNTTFLGNVTDGNGGAIFASKPYELTDCRIESNVAAKQGGGVYSSLNGSLVGTRIVGNLAKVGGGGVYLTKASACLAAGTKILMADGSEKNIENVIEGDEVATFDHEGGTNSTAAVCLAYSGKGSFPAVTLTFASGETLMIVDRHDLLSEMTRKYVTLTTDNAENFIGARFYNYKIASWDELTDVVASDRVTACYSLYAAHHLNCVANGLLTVADDVDWYLNIYELDDSLKADGDQLAADIAEFGLLDINEYPELATDPEAFDNFNTRYARIVMGKGLASEEVLWKIYSETESPEEAKTSSAPRPKLVMSAPRLTQSTLEVIPTPRDPYLQVGEGTVVTGNVIAAGDASNVWLDGNQNAVINILSDVDTIDVGVTLSSGAGIFGWTNAVNHAASFFADDPTYCVSYTADGELALRAGIQVGGDAWATIDADGTCTIIGTGDMWNMSAAKATPLWGLAITNVVVKDGITSVGAHVFEKMSTVKDVSLAASVTTIGSLAFHKCYLLTNVVGMATGTMSVGDGAFLRCNSLERLGFGGEATFGQEAYTLQAGIRMEGGMPVIYPIPQIECAGYSQQLMGSNDLKSWQVITTESQKLDYHYFKIALEPVEEAK